MKYSIAAPNATTPITNSIGIPNKELKIPIEISTPIIIGSLNYLTIQ